MIKDHPQRTRAASRSKISRLTAAVTAAALAVAPVSALAQENKGPALLRDTEIEQLLRDYTRPILRTAGLEKQNIQVVIINDSGFNAFVADGRRIFVNYGALMKSETPNQIIGVLAHETGHLAGGHLAKMREQLAQAQTQMIIAMLLGAGAIVAGREERQQQQRPQQCRRRRDQRAAGGHQAHPALLHSAAGGKRRPRRGQVFDRHRPIGQGHVRDLPAIYQREPVRGARRRSLSAIAPDAGGSCRGPWGTRAVEPVLGQEGRSGAATASRHDARQDLRVHGARRTPSTGAIRCPTPACPRAMRMPSPPIGTAT